MPPEEEDGSTPSDDDEEEQALASVMLASSEWLFIISCLSLVHQSHHTQTKECRDQAYHLELKIVDELARKRNAPVS